MLNFFKAIFDGKAQREQERKARVHAHVARVLRCADKTGRALFACFDVKKVSDGLYDVDGESLCGFEDIVFLFEAFLKDKKYTQTVTNRYQIFL
jgi:hypothetical protein